MNNFVISFLFFNVLLMGCQKNQLSSHFIKDSISIKGLKIKKLQVSSKKIIEKFEFESGDRVIIQNFEKSKEEDFEILFNMELSTFKQSNSAYPDFISKHRNCPVVSNLKTVQGVGVSIIKYIADERYNSTFCSEEDIKYQRDIEFKNCKNEILKIETFVNTDESTIRKLKKKIKCID